MALLTQNVEVPGEHVGAGSRWLSVRQAASALGCSPQTVRNWIRDGRLHGVRVSRGSRTDIYEVLEDSVEAQIAKTGRLSAERKPESARPSSLFAELSHRVRALEEHQSAPTPDQINILFANLRLLEIHEEYDRALEAMLAADENRRRAVESMRKVASSYRAALEQFHLPPSPPP